MRAAVLALVLLAVAGAIWLLARDEGEARVVSPIRPSSVADGAPGFRADAAAPPADQPLPAPVPALGDTTASPLLLPTGLPPMPTYAVPTRRVEGRIVRASDGTPIAGVAVMYEDADIRASGSSRDPDGAFCLLHVAQSAEAIVLSRKQRIQRVPLVPGSGSLSDLRVVFDSGFRVTGQVLDDRGNPIPGAEVGCESSGAADTTDSSGRFALRDVASSGRIVSIHARAPLRAKRIVEIPVPENPAEIATADFRLAEAGLIAGRVSLPDGKAATGMSIRLAIERPSGEAEPASKWTTSDAQGDYVAENVPPGRYRVLAATDLGFSVLADPKSKSGKFSNRDELLGEVGAVLVTAGTPTHLDIALRRLP